MKFLWKALFTILAAVAANSSFAQAWPNKPVRIVVGFAPGGPADIVARFTAEYLQQELGQSVIVENRAGAGGQIGTQYVARSPADGYTLLMTSSNAHGAGPSLWEKTPYDPMKDFTHLALIAQAPIVLVAKTSSPLNNLTDVIQAARDKPGSINFGSGGAGGMGHLTGELLQSVANFSITHVPYKGSSAALTDLVGGQIQLISDVMASYVPHVQSGSVKFLAVSTTSRIARFPNLMTFTEQGYPQATASAWFGLTAPAHIPNEAVEKLSAAVLKVVENPKLRARFEEVGLITDVSRANPQAFTQFVQSELQRWNKVSKERNLKMN